MGPTITFALTDHQVTLGAYIEQETIGIARVWHAADQLLQTVPLERPVSRWRLLSQYLDHAVQPSLIGKQQNEHVLLLIATAVLLSSGIARFFCSTVLRVSAGKPNRLGKK